MTCTRCDAPHLPADPECPRCGLPFENPAPSDPTPSPYRTTASSERPWILRGTAVVGVLVCAFLALNYLGLGADDSSASSWRPNDLPGAEIPGNEEPGNGPPTGPNLASTASITAARTADPAQDDAGAEVTYEAQHMIDGDLRTTWRAPGYYNGEDITITLPAPTQIQVVGLTNGYTKIDEQSGADRYADGRKIQSVTWSFDNGTSVDQDLSKNNREIQYERIDPVQTQTIRLTINATTTPGKFTDDYTAITEVFLSTS